MRKILIAIDSINILWWAEKVVMDQIKLFKKNNIQIELYWTKKKHISLLDGFLSIFNIKEYFRFKKYLKKNNFNIIHIHKFHSFLSPSILLAIPKKTKIILHVHDFKFYCPKLWVNKKWIECKWWLLHFNCKRPIERLFIKNLIFDLVKWIKFILNRFLIKKYVNTFICPSKKLQKYIIKSLKLDKNKVIYIPNFIEIENWYYPDFSNINPKKFLFVWRLSKEKWVEIAIKAFDLLVNKQWLKDIIFEIIWDWPEKDNLQKLVKKLNIENNIKFLWKINNKNLWSYYNSSIAVLMPSMWLENNPLVWLESMKYWKPIIATNVWWYPDLIENNKNWYLFPLWNYIELVKKIKNLYKNKKLSIKYWEYWFEKVIKEFNKENFYKKLIKIYKI